ncbi:MAG: NAD-dependent malic enzyme, partial [Planctomycetota bacterium]|nr:NAD-dependent malic enzyme [Planctomycetota bacterium]
EIVGADCDYKIRDVQVYIVEQEHIEHITNAIKSLKHCELVRVTDDVLEIHRGGAIETISRVNLDSVSKLRMVYTPGVASVCTLIENDPEKAWEYTHKGNRIAIVTNGTAVLGLGDIGALAGLPVMEGKAAILAHFVGVSADPILIDSKDPLEIINITSKISSQYGAIQLEDIGAPTCFEVEEALDEMLDVPVFHDDQHGTATVLLAGLIGAMKKTNREFKDLNVAMMGAGAAGIAIAKLLLEMGVNDLVMCDSKGALHEGRDDLNPWKMQVANRGNKDNITGNFEEVIKDKNLFIGVSRPNTVSKAMISSMASDPIVFPLANPVSEISVEDAIEAGAAIAVDGRGMNNALAYPGLFRGALDARAKKITTEMKLAAARALADSATDSLMPDMLDLSVHEHVTNMVREAWEKHGLGNQDPKPE